MSALSWVLVAMLAAPERDPDVVRGEQAYREERWSDASEAFAAAYARTGDPTYLYTQAQAERRGGHCEVAIELLERFLDTEPAEVAAATARGYIAECREQLGPGETSASAEPASSPSSEVAVGPVDEAPPVTVPRPWWRDPWGGALVGVGTAALVGGGVLVGLARRGADRALEAESDAGYGDRIASAEAMQIAGVTVMSVGAAAVIGGVVRWVVLARRGRARRGKVAVVPGVGGISVVGWVPSLSGRGLTTSTSRSFSVF